MKLIIILLAIILVNSISLSENIYFYSNQQKHYFQTLDNSFAIKFNDEKSELLKILSLKQNVFYKKMISKKNNLFWIEGQENYVKEEFKKNLIDRGLKGDIYPIYFQISKNVFGINDTSYFICFDEIIVKFLDGITKARIDSFNRIYSVSIIKFNKYKEYILRVPQNLNFSTINYANIYFESKLTEWSQPNFYSEVRIESIDDPKFPAQWHLNNTGQGGGVVGVDIRAINAWNISTGSPDVIVAILDDGVENHEEFYDGQLVPGFTSDDLSGNDGLPEPNNKHGQAVAGIIAANHNNIGVRGIAPNVRIISIRVVGNDGDMSSDANIAAAIDTAWIRGSSVLNMSWSIGGENYYSNNIADAIGRAHLYGRNGKGCLVVKSAGNNASNYVTFPGTVNGVIAVGAVTNLNNAALYTPNSSRVDVVAPSSSGSFFKVDKKIVTIDRMGSSGYDDDNYYGDFGGTSAAAPQVSAIGALLISQFPYLNARPIGTNPDPQVQLILKRSSDYYANTNTLWAGHGRVNAYRALEHGIDFLQDPNVNYNVTYSINPPKGGLHHGEFVNLKLNIFPLVYNNQNTTWRIFLVSARYNGQIEWVEEGIPSGINMITGQDESLYLENNNFRKYFTELNNHKDSLIKVECSKWIDGELRNYITIFTFRSKVRPNLPPPPPRDPGCPFVYSYVNDEWQIDNNILPQSEQSENQGQDVTDYYQLFTTPQRNDGIYRLAVAEYEEEISYVDQFQLLTVDHSPEAQITVNDEGNIIQFTKPAFLADATLDSEEVIKQISQLDNVKVETNQDDSLHILFTDNGGLVYEQGLLIVAKLKSNSTKKMIAGSIVSTAEQNNKSFSSFRLRRNPSYTWVLIPASDTNSLQIDVRWKQDSEVDFTELSQKLELPFSIHTTQLISAEHSSNGNITEQLQTIDQQYGELSTGDWIDLRFTAPPIMEGMERSFIFVSHGRYEIVHGENLANKIKQLPSKKINEHSIQAKLDQNIPNPFNPTTRIGYSLTKDMYVTLKIYDVLGREITTLVSEFQTSGYNTVTFDASKYPNGIYLYKLQAGNYIDMKKMVLIK
ncbi:MAG: S8 family serine peptidase [Bacteroidota bacterium]